MAAEKTGGNHPAHAGAGNTNSNVNNSNPNKGQGKSNRRRPLRSKRRGRKPEEGSEARGQRNDQRSEQRAEPRESRALSNANKPVDKNVRDNRERRRRRRMRAKQRGPNEPTTTVVEDTFKDLPPLVPAFVYTHVLRPSMRDSFEFRTEHFSKVTRKLDDFHIDLSPLYPEGGDEIKGVAYMPPLAESAEFARDFEPDFDPDAEPEHIGEGDEGNATLDVEAYDAETYDNPDWDAEESDDAARLDGAVSGEVNAAIADDFYEELDDSVVDEYPEEDVDA